MTRMKFLIPIALLFALAPVVLAQQDCPAIVQAALAAVDSACAVTARNQVCYGNIQLEVTAREGVSDFQFTQAGDIADIANIQHLQLSSFSMTDASWGLALMKLQANLPDTLPGQNVTFLMFGDVQVENAVKNTPEVSVKATRNANVRSLPSTTENNVIASLKNGQEIIANGRLDDNSWVRIKLEGDAGGTGWVAAQFISGKLDALAVIEPKAPQSMSMQSFYFKTGLTDRPCDQAPDSGILVQSPHGASRVSFTANGVDITLGSTIYLQTGGGYMTVTVVEGMATLTAFGQSQIVPAGTLVRLPLGQDRLVSGPPESPQPYDASQLQALPLKLSLWETVEVVPSLSPDEITAAIAALEPPQSGTWSMSTRADGEGNCRFKAMTQSVSLTFHPDDTFTLVFSSTGDSLLFTHSSDKTYAGTTQYPAGTYSMVFTFTSPTTFTGTYTLDGSQCDGSTTLTGTWSSP